MSNSFNVVLTGELLKGQSIMQAANSLSKLFKIAPIQAQQMLARAPLVIKKNLEEDTALRFVQAMYKSGFGAAVEEQKSTKTTFLHPFAAHYDDEDEEAAVTRITPVLVEQSRLEESLDTELTIPVAAAPPVVAAPEAVHSTALAGNEAEIILEPVAPAESASASELLSASAEEFITPSADSADVLVEEIQAFDVAPSAPVDAVVAEDVLVESSEVASVELIQGPVEASVAEFVQTLEADSAAQQTLNDFELLATAAEHIAEPVLNESAEQTAANSVAVSLDPFTPWGETSVQDEENPTELTAQAYGIEDYGIEEIAADSACEVADTPQAADAEEQAEGQSQMAPCEAKSVPVEAEAQLAAPLPADDWAADPSTAEQSLPAIGDPAETIPTNSEEAAASAVPDAEEALEPTAAAEFTEVVAVANEADTETAAEEIATAEAQSGDLQICDIQVADVQWIEPVAQWQTVAELAEDMTQTQGVAATYETAEQAAPAALAEQGAWGAEAGGADHLSAPPTDFGRQAMDFAEPAEQLPDAPAHWDDAVEISPALTERLAQIAEASKEHLDGPELSDAQIDQNPLDANDAAEGVLLFEAADVTEISAASWDDWHASDAMAVSGTAAFNPLLDFDQVVPDWQNSSLELLFDNAEAPHQGGVTAANEQELAAFLEASEDYRSEPQAFEQAPEAQDTGTAYTDQRASDDLAPLNAVTELAELAAAPTADASVNEPNPGAPQSAWVYDISVQANCGFLEVVIPQGRELHVAAAAAVTMGLSLHEQLNAGSSVRAWLLAKGFLLNTYEAVESAGNLGITAITHGMVCAIDASDFPVMVQQSAYLASTDDVQLNADQSRLNPVVSASKWIHCSGTGELWLNAQGLWEMVEVDGCYRINSRYLMAFSKSLELKAPPLAGLKSYLTSGNGVECRLTGRGVVWVQTEAARAPVIWQ